jgi:anthranilate synthase component 2
MRTRTLLLDNFDSFTYNLYHHLRYLGEDVKVVRNNEKNWKSFDASHIVLSPGPGLPESSGELMDCLEYFKGKRPILGVCLGHQAIALSKGMSLFNLPSVRHGQQLKINKAVETCLLKGIPDQFEAGFYHSWAVSDSEKFSAFVSSRDSEGVIMSLEFAEDQLYGVQFHPESIMCPQGMSILKNFLFTSL